MTATEEPTMSECISHHYACECREAMYAELVEAAREVCTPVRPSEAVEARLRACLAQLEGRDPLDVFTGGGA